MAACQGRYPCNHAHVFGGKGKAGPCRAGGGMILEGQEGSRFEAQLRCDGTIADLATSLLSPIVASSLMQSARPVTYFAGLPTLQRRSICTHHTEITAQHCKGASDKAPRRSIPLAAKSMTKRSSGRTCPSCAVPGDHTQSQGSASVSEARNDAVVQRQDPRVGGDRGELERPLDAVETASDDWHPQRGPRDPFPPSFDAAAESSRQRPPSPAGSWTLVG